MYELLTGGLEVDIDAELQADASEADKEEKGVYSNGAGGTVDNSNDPM